MVASPGHVQQLDAGDGLHRLVVGEGPDDLLVGRDFDQVRRLAELAVARASCDITVLPLGRRCRPVMNFRLMPGSSSAVTSQTVLPPLSTSKTRGRLGHVAAGDQRVAVGQADDAVRAAGARDLPHDLALRIVFADDLLAVVGDEVVAVGQSPGVAHVGVAAVLALGQQADFLDDLARRIDLQQPPGVALADEGVAVGQALAGVDFALGLVVEDDLLLARDFLHAVAGVEQQVAVGQHPQVVAVRAPDIPTRPCLRPKR